MQKKLELQSLSFEDSLEQATGAYQSFYSFRKMEESYRHKIKDLVKRINEQDVLIERQSKKIKEISKYMTENYELKSLLGNME